jgi:hypothetical protein
MFLTLSAWAPRTAVKTAPAVKSFQYYFYDYPYDDYLGFATIADMEDELTNYYGYNVDQSTGGTLVAEGYLSPWSLTPTVKLYAHLPFNP